MSQKSANQTRKDESTYRKFVENDLSNSSEESDGDGSSSPNTSSSARKELSTQSKRKMNSWTSQEDQKLKNIMQNNDGKTWREIADMFPNKTQTQCSQRWRKLLAGSRQRWSKEEDVLLLDYVSKYGHNWALISSMISGRSGKQVRERFINKLDPNINRGRFTEEEDQKILRLFQRLGAKWAEISRSFEGRPENMIKNRFYSHIRKKYNITVDESADNGNENPETSSEANAVKSETRDSDGKALEGGIQNLTLDVRSGDDENAGEKDAPLPSVSNSNKDGGMSIEANNKNANNSILSGNNSQMLISPISHFTNSPFLPHLLISPSMRALGNRQFKFNFLDTNTPPVIQEEDGEDSKSKKGGKLKLVVNNNASRRESKSHVSYMSMEEPFSSLNTPLKLVSPDGYNIASCRRSPRKVSPSQPILFDFANNENKQKQEFNNPKSFSDILEIDKDETASDIKNESGFQFDFLSNESDSENEGHENESPGLKQILKHSLDSPTKQQSSSNRNKRKNPAEEVPQKSIQDDEKEKLRNLAKIIWRSSASKKNGSEKEILEKKKFILENLLKSVEMQIQQLKSN